MTVPTVGVAAVGAKITADAWNDGVGALLSWIEDDRPITWVLQSGSQTVSHNTWTPITFAGEPIDRASMHSTSSNTSRINIGLSLGLYLVIGRIAWAGDSTGLRYSSLRVNGTEIDGTQSISPPGSSFVSVTTWGVATAASSGDYLELYGLQTSGGNLDTSVSGPFKSSLLAVRIGA